MEQVSARIDAVVVIPCLNEEIYIGAIIAGILRDPAARSLLIVVADGGSTDRTLAIVAQLAETTPQVRLIANSLKLQSAGVNLAARLFGDGRRWLIRMDAHAEYPEGFVSILIAEATRKCADSVVVAMTAHGKSCFQHAVAVAQNSLLGAGGSPHRSSGKEGFVDHGHHALFDIDHFLALDGYDETQSHNEDAEFDLRLIRTGGRIWLTRATTMVYFPRSGIRALYRQYRNYGRGRASTILRHRSRPKLRQVLPAAVAPSLLCALFAPLWWPAALPVMLWLGVCGLFGVVLGLRDGTRCAFASACAAPVMHLGWSVGFWSACLMSPLRSLHRRGAAVKAGAR